MCIPLLPYPTELPNFLVSGGSMICTDGDAAMGINFPGLAVNTSLYALARHPCRSRS